MKWLSVLSEHTKIENAPYRNAFNGIRGTLGLNNHLKH